MRNFGIPQRAARMVRQEMSLPFNWRRGAFRAWVLASAGWIMAWSIYLLLESLQGGLETSGERLMVPVVLFVPPLALWMFGMTCAWTVRGFVPERH